VNVALLQKLTADQMHWTFRTFQQADFEQSEAKQNLEANEWT